MRFESRRLHMPPTGVKGGVKFFILGCLLCTSSSSRAATTFNLEEGTNFTGNCSNNSLNTVTASLQIAMVAAGWTGARYVNDQAVATDFVESCTTGYGYDGYAKDNLYGDARSVIAYAGHGTPHTLYFPTWNHGCNLSFPNNMRSGQMGGGQAAIAMWLACEELDDFDTLGDDQHLRQQMGFTNVIAIRNDEPRDVFNRTKATTVGGIVIPAQSNADAWLDVMDGLGQNGVSRDPIVISYSDFSGDCWSVHDNAKMKSNNYNTPRPSPPICGAGLGEWYYCWEGYR